MSSIDRDETQKSKLNVPNALSFLRLAGSVVLVFVALAENSDVFLWLFVFLLMTDWVDGKLAILLKQQTTFGARLDSVADASMYAALLFGTCWLKWDVVAQEAPWLIAAVASYALTSGAGLIKYGRVPSYHTRAAKTCWFLVGVSAIFVFADWSVWPLRITAIGGVLTNIEAIAITLVLPEWTADVTSIYHAVKSNRHKEESNRDSNGSSV
jgi:CDP-diacylglycerol--glycerol-3-phosphate 3-phosphatidyltransferase